MSKLNVFDSFNLFFAGTTDKRMFFNIFDDDKKQAPTFFSFAESSLAFDAERDFEIFKFKPINTLHRELTIESGEN